MEKNQVPDELNVLVIDHSYLNQVSWAQHFAETTTGFNVILVTDKLPTGHDGKLEIVNVNDRRSSHSIEEIQQRVGFSLYKALVPERAYFDYTSLTRSACYSRLSFCEIGERVSAYIYTLDELIRERAGVVLGHLADNGIASVAALLAKNYDKPYMASFPNYWWADGFIVYDQPDQTSTQVDLLYQQFYSGKMSIDRPEIDRIYSVKRANLRYGDNETYRFSDRIRKISRSRNWHEPFSFLNWVLRRGSFLISELKVMLFTSTKKTAISERPYVLFPLHVAPEAALLGASPELADQLSLIKNISINLPWGVDLYVKKHPGQKGWNGPNFDFFNKLAALPNVQVIDAKVSALSILDDQRCVAVATINSTVGLEAAIKHKPVFVFGRAIYGVADCFLKPENFTEFEKQILSIIQGHYSFDELALYSILAAMDKSVWHGEENFLIKKTVLEYALSCGIVYEKYIKARPWTNGFQPQVND